MWRVRTRETSESGGLTAFDAAKIIGILIAVVAVAWVVAKIVGAIVTLIWIVVAGAAIVAAGWVLWSLLRGGKDR